MSKAEIDRARAQTEVAQLSAVVDEIRLTLDQKEQDYLRREDSQSHQHKYNEDELRRQTKTALELKKKLQVSEVKADTTQIKLRESNNLKDRQNEQLQI